MPARPASPWPGSWPGGDCGSWSWRPPTELGNSWRTRWDSLRLFTPAQYDALPGMAFPAPADTYPGKEAVADFLRDYATAFDLPVRLGKRVTALSRIGDGFEVRTGDEVLRAQQVVVATGPFQVPFIPQAAHGFDDSVTQIHSADYRNPQSLPPGPVLVVGAGNSGLQIAEELAATRQVDLAIGEKVPMIPQRLLGRDLFWWLTRLGFMRVNTANPARPPAAGPRRVRHRQQPPPAHGAPASDSDPAWSNAREQTARFADGSSLDVGVVIWATGYRSDYSWIAIPGVAADGRVMHRRGVTDVPGLYFLGLSWQYTRGSALLGFVADDAAYLDRTDRHQGRRQRTEPGRLWSPLTHPAWAAAVARDHRKARREREITLFLEQTMERRIPAGARRQGGKVMANQFSAAETSTPGPASRDNSEACAPRWSGDVLWGALQAASPIGFWWLPPATVYGLGLALIAAVYIGFAVADGRPKIIAVESAVAGGIRGGSRCGRYRTGLAPRRRSRRPRSQGCLATPHPVRRQHTMVAAVLCRRRLDCCPHPRHRDRGRGPIPLTRDHGPGTAGGQRTDGGAGHCEYMSTTPDRQVLALPEGLCSKCVRALSRRLRDLPGVVWFNVDAAAAQVLIAGDVDLPAAEAVIRELGCS